MMSSACLKNLPCLLMFLLSCHIIFSINDIAVLSSMPLKMFFLKFSWVSIFLFFGSEIIFSSFFYVHKR